MLGIIEEQRISRRKPATTYRAQRGKPAHADSPTGAGNRFPRGEDRSWVTNGSAAPVLTDAETIARTDVDRIGDVAERERATEPFLPSSTAHQKPARRRADRLWLRRFVRPRKSMTSIVLGRQSGTLSNIPTCYLSPLMAAPVALLVLALVLNTVIGSRGFVASHVPVAMPVSAAALLAVAPEPESYVATGEPLSIDATSFERIRRTEYVVKRGDTISEIAQSFGLDPGTILGMNAVNDVRRLLPGTVLSIANRDGLPHTVQPGESLSSIAENYRITVAALADANDVRSPILQVGDTLFVPGARMDTDIYLQRIGELFSWPVRSFTFTSRFGMRNHPISSIWHLHTGIDLANRVGTPVRAAGSGRVVHVENQASNYGKMIIIDHGNGFRTLYGHLDSFAVSYGEYVTAGEQIGTMGSTGRSTGSHLHFSVFRGNQPIDPESQLPVR